MRELDKRVAAVAQGLLPGALLLVGARSGALNAVSTVEHPEDAAGGPYDAALWLAPADGLALRVGIVALRAKLKPGAPLALAVARRPPVLEQVRGMLGGPAPEPIELSTLCGALLASGLVLPRLHEGPRTHHLLSGTLPRDPCALDAFFTQPPTR